MPLICRLRFATSKIQVRNRGWNRFLRFRHSPLIVLSQKVAGEGI
jgi:hypothetical protein